jgi:hypothetical protein
MRDRTTALVAELALPCQTEAASAIGRGGRTRLILLPLAGGRVAQSLFLKELYVGEAHTVATASAGSS